MLYNKYVAKSHLRNSPLRYFQYNTVTGENLLLANGVFFRPAILTGHGRGRKKTKIISNGNVERSPKKSVGLPSFRLYRITHPCTNVSRAILIVLAHRVLRRYSKTIRAGVDFRTFSRPPNVPCGDRSAVRPRRDTHANRPTHNATYFPYLFLYADKYS